MPGQPGDEGVVSRLDHAQQLVVYPLGTCDGPAVLAVISQLMTGQTNVKISVDPKSNSLVALAVRRSRPRSRPRWRKCSRRTASRSSA